MTKNGGEILQAWSVCEQLDFLIHDSNAERNAGQPLLAAIAAVTTQDCYNCN